MVNSIYLDNHSATRPFPSAIDKSVLAHKEHWKPIDAMAIADSSLKWICDLLGMKGSDSFVFASSRFDAASQLFLSTYSHFVRETGRNHFLTTTVEETPITSSLKYLERFGCVAKKLPVTAQGQLTPAILEEAIKPRGALVSLSWANGLTGVIHPIEELVAVCQRKEVALHLDVSGVIGKNFFRFQDLGVDFLTFGGDPFHAIKGIGGIVSKEGSYFHPMTPHLAALNGPALASLGFALEQSALYLDHLGTETVRLRDKLEKGIQEGIADAVIFFQDVTRLPNCSTIGFPGVSSEALLYALHRKGVYASSGGGYFQKLSEVLISCGVEASLAHSALSFSLSYETKEEEIDRVLEILIPSVKKLRQLSNQIQEG